MVYYNQDKERGIKAMTRYYDVAVGKMFKSIGALFVVMPFDLEEDVYFNVCVWSKNTNYEAGCKYVFLDETPVVEVDEKLLEKLHSLLDN